MSGFALTLAIWSTIAVVAVFGVVVHEIGHYGAASVLGYDAHIVVRRCGFQVGVGTLWSSDRLPPPSHRMLVTAAGPLASLAAGAAGALAYWPFGVIVAGIGLAQLIPLPHSDGVKLLRDIADHFSGARTGHRELLGQAVVVRDAAQRRERR